jgi:hypothetical protein
MSWVVLVGLMALGIITIAVAGRPATAIAAAGVPLAMVVLGVGQIYPLLDLRTSHVLFVLANALAGIGIAGVASWLGRWLGRRSATLGAVGSGAMILVAVTAYADANRDWLRLGSRAGPGAIRTAYGLEDVRTAVDYVRRHRRPGDVVLVGPLGAYAFAYYWPADVPTLADRPGFALRWGPTYPAGSGIVVVPSLTAESIRTGTATAVRLARERGPATRIWLIRSHAPPSELAEWTTALQGMRTETTPSGREPAVLVEPAANP